MSVKLSIRVKQIRCNDTEDRNRDEIYFIATTASVKSTTTRAVRRIEQGDFIIAEELDESQKNVFDADVNENAVVTIVAVEQRIAQDKSAMSDALIKLGSDAVIFGREKIKEIASNNYSEIKEEVLSCVIDFISKKVTSTVKKVFQDTLLGYLVIPAFDEKVSYPADYTMTIENEDGAGKIYNYEIRLDVDSI